MRLLHCLLQAAGRVAEREQLYKTVFGHPAYPTDRSLDMLVSRLRRKLGPRPDGGERIRAVRGEGYMYLCAGEGSCPSESA
jgi:two-component system response regulator CpxR